MPQLVHLTADHIEYLINAGKTDLPLGNQDALVTLYRFFRTFHTELVWDDERAVLQALYTLNQAVIDLKMYDDGDMISNNG